MSGQVNEDLLTVIRSHTLAYAEPGPSETVTDFLFNERLALLEREGAWLRVRNLFDDYEGWIEADATAVAPPTDGAPRRCAGRLSPAYGDAQSSTPVFAVGCGTALWPEAAEGDRVRDVSGLWFLRDDFHPLPVAKPFQDITLQYLGVKYVWGGRYGDGIDCSGLVQIAALLKGLTLPRDTSQQRDVVGEAIGPLDRVEVQTGDLLYVPGHVAVLLSADEACHANGKQGRVMRQDVDELLAERGFDRADALIRRLRFPDAQS
jgi:hypothetical protein